MAHEAPREGWEEVLTQAKELLIFSPACPQETRGNIMEAVLKEVSRRHLALKLRLAAAAERVDRVDSRRSELMVAELCPRSDFASADRLVGNSAEAMYLRRPSTQAAQQLGINSGRPEPKWRGWRTGRANILRSRDRRRKCVAAGIR